MLEALLISMSFEDKIVNLMKEIPNAAPLKLARKNPLEWLMSVLWGRGPRVECGWLWPRSDSTLQAARGESC